MAIIDKSGNIVGRLGDLRYYTRNGKNIVATKGGPTAKQIKTKASYASTRARNDEFSLASRLSSNIYSSQIEFKPFRHTNAYQKLMQSLIQLFEQDVLSKKGQRSLLFSAAPHHFDHLLYSRIPYSTYSTLKPSWSKSSSNKLKFILKDRLVNTKCIFPKNYNKVNWSVSVQGIKDIEFDKKKSDFNFIINKSVEKTVKVLDLEFAKGSNIPKSSYSISIKEGFNYLVFACATYVNSHNSKLPPIHTIELLEVIPK